MGVGVDPECDGRVAVAEPCGDDVDGCARQEELRRRLRRCETATRAKDKRILARGTGPGCTVPALASCSWVVSAHSVVNGTHHDLG